MSVQDNVLSFLAIADAQYADYSPKMGRYYKNSILKLRQIYESEKNNKYEFIINLGDIIDRPIEFLEPVICEFEKFNLPLYNVLGNHDMEKSKIDGEKVKKRLIKTEKTFYTFDKSNWRFIVLDGTRLSKYSLCNDKTLMKEFEKLYAPLHKTFAPCAQIYNGGVDKEQIKWLIEELKKADSENKKVVVFCHFQLLPSGGHSLYNHKEISDILCKYNCVKTCISGHNHRGAYAEKDGLHFVTLAGLCEEELTVSYASIKLTNDNISIRGFGLIKPLELPIRK